MVHKFEMKKFFEEQSWKNVVLFFYQNQKGEIKGYKVEVYECNSDRFYGYDLHANKIKTFLYERVTHPMVECSFIPRYEHKDFND